MQRATNISDATCFVRVPNSCLHNLVENKNKVSQPFIASKIPRSSFLWSNLAIGMHLINLDTTRTGFTTTGSISVRCNVRRFCSAIVRTLSLLYLFLLASGSNESFGRCEDSSPARDLSSSQSYRKVNCFLAVMK
jgi:hypothetical protein